MKKLVLPVCLLILAAPFALAAGGNNNNTNNKKRQGAAPEMPSIALGVAAAIGVAGYLVLRQRHAHEN